MITKLMKLLRRQIFRSTFKIVRHSITRFLKRISQSEILKCDPLRTYQKVFHVSFRFIIFWLLIGYCEKSISGIKRILFLQVQEPYLYLILTNMMRI